MLLKSLIFKTLMIAKNSEVVSLYSKEVLTIKRVRMKDGLSSNKTKEALKWQ